MRKRYRVLMFSALVAALVVPVGYALSVESMPEAIRHTTPGYATVMASPSVPNAAAAIVVAPVNVYTSSAAPAAPEPHPVPDAAKLLGIGTALFGLAALVRKAI